MSKNVLILSYEGNVEIINAKRNMSQNELINIARKKIQDEKGIAITNLNNIDYLTEAKMNVYFNKMSEQNINKDDIVDYTITL